MFGKSIGGKIFGAFAAMSIIIAALGLYGYVVLSRTGDITVSTFDGPLMAISYARAAHFDFSEMQRKLLERGQATGPARDAADSDLNDLTSTFSSDLDVAEQRSTDQSERAVIEQIRALFARWSAARKAQDAERVKDLQTKLDDRFDMLVELNTDHGFVARRDAVDSIGESEYLTLATIGLSLLFALSIAFFLARRIVRPLSAAASVADLISKGEFETEIPTGGNDETGTLLHSMTVMQDNIRVMMAREAERRRSAENRLIDALETSDEGVMLVSAEGRVLVVNTQLRRFFPGVADRLVPGADFATAFELVQSQLKQIAEVLDLSSGHTEHQLIDGRWVRFTVSGTSDGGTIVFLSDFTSIKEREESYRCAKQEAEAASAAKSRFVANMSHELRTPLNAIIGFSEMISGEVFGPLGHGRYKEYARDILGSGHRLLDVINSVLELAHSEAGRITLQAENLDIHALLKDCARDTAKECEAAKLQFVSQGLDQPMPIFGERAKLRQIFLNLLSNAVKFNKPGGRVTLSVHKNKDRLTVEVADTGIGMTLEGIEVALTPFAQVDNRLERRYEGAGLGLPLTRAFVELHGGRIDIESTAGAGTTVSVSFALASDNVVRMAG